MGSAASRESHLMGTTASKSGRKYGSRHQQHQQHGGSLPPYLSRVRSLPSSSPLYRPSSRRRDDSHQPPSLALEPLPDTNDPPSPDHVDAEDPMHLPGDPPLVSKTPADCRTTASVGRSLSLHHGFNGKFVTTSTADDPQSLRWHLSDELTRLSTLNSGVELKDSGQQKPAIPSSKISPEVPPPPPPGSEGKIVVYFTSLRGIRRTFEDCCAVRWIFRGFKVYVDERDVSMDSSYRRELESAFGGSVSLPQVFVGGKYIGGAEEVRYLAEIGELGKILQGFPVREKAEVCAMCGDARFFPCENCHGSRKVYEEEDCGGSLRRCTECNENGLVRCPLCCC
ncbi:uncharacterized protein LOC116246979 [Nymphaea colorata]|nr:uncharacterized protein LOC116246979 [Nymphaea colorata]